MQDIAYSDPLHDAALAAPGAAAVLDADAVSFDALDNAAHIDVAALGPGDVVALRMNAAFNAIRLLFALVRAGRSALPVNPHFPEGYLREALASCDCDQLVTDQTIETAALGAGMRVTSPDTLWHGTKGPAPAATDAGAPAVLVFTSGSEGAPKAAALTMGNLVHSARCANAVIPLGPGNGWLLSLPLFHVSGLGVVFRCIEARSAIVLPRPGATLLESLQRPEVTHVSLVATQLHRLLREPGGPETLRGLKAILCGGSAFPPALLEEAAAAGLPLCMSYGMTETAALIAVTRPGEGIEAWHSAGAPLTPDTVRIAASGEIQVRGASLFAGYLQPPGAPERLLRPVDAAGWFGTGDLGRIDAHGRLHVTGRIGNQFICGGENVQPEEIERALLALPGVCRARVVAVPDTEFVHVPVAFVDAPAGLAAAAIIESLRPALPRHALPRRILPWPGHLEREGEKLSRAQLEHEAARS